MSTGAFDTTHNGAGDVFVSRLNAAGSALTHSTFLGTSSAETGRAIAVDGANAFVTGDTPGATFPVTAGAADTSHNGSADVFVAKLNMTPTRGAGLRAPDGRLAVAGSAGAGVRGLHLARPRCTARRTCPGGTNPDGSCAPPVHQSNHVTIGTPDSNGKPVNSVGFVQLKTLTGNAAT